MRKKIIAMLLVIAFMVTPIYNVSKPHVVQRFDNITTVGINGRIYDVVVNNNNVTVKSNADNGKVNMVLDQEGTVQICSCDNYGHIKRASMKIDEMSKNNVNTSLRVLLCRICVPYGHNLHFKSVHILSGAF